MINSKSAAFLVKTSRMKYFALAARPGTAIGQEPPKRWSQHADSIQGLYRLLSEMQGIHHALGPGPTPTPPAAVSVREKPGFSLLLKGGPGQAAPTRHAERAPPAVPQPRQRRKLIYSFIQYQRWQKGRTERETQTQTFLPFFKFLPWCQGTRASSLEKETPDKNISVRGTRAETKNASQDSLGFVKGSSL